MRSKDFSALGATYDRYIFPNPAHPRYGMILFLNIFPWSHPFAVWHRGLTTFIFQRSLYVESRLETAIELGTRVGGESGTTSFQRIAPLGAGSNTFS